MGEWIKCSDRLPERGVTVLVYTPANPKSPDDGDRIDFDCLDPDGDIDYWMAHGDHYEHYCMVAKGGSDVQWTGPSEKAPYTHWAPIPEPPK